MTDTIDADPGTDFTASLDLTPAMTGLVGTLAVRIVDPGVKEVPVPRTTVGINEFPLGSGIYGVTLKAPLAPGLYVVMWDISPLGPYTTSNSWGQPLTVTIEDPVFPGGWSWTPYGWLDPEWYDGNDFNVSDASPGSNPVPTAADVRAVSKLDFTQYDYSDATKDALPGGLGEIVAQAESMFWRVTGQTLDQIDAKAAPLVRRVITGMTEHMVMQSAPDQLDTQSDWELITSFGAGPYNENRRSAGEMFQGRMLFPVPWISQSLWSLCTFERYSFWLQFFSGVNMPAFETTDVFWEEGLMWGRMWTPNSPQSYWWGA